MPEPFALDAPLPLLEATADDGTRSIFSAAAAAVVARELGALSPALLEQWRGAFAPAVAPAADARAAPSGGRGARAAASASVAQQAEDVAEPSRSALRTRTALAAVSARDEAFRLEHAPYCATLALRSCTWRALGRGVAEAAGARCTSVTTRACEAVAVELRRVSEWKQLRALAPEV